jgi:N6-L-threonylcarbamoyladenine synthase
LARKITKKLKKAWLITKFKTIVIGGGVIANKFLRNYLIRNVNKWDRKVNIFIPEIEYSTDNAAMIGITAYYKINHEIQSKGIN